MKPRARYPVLAVDAAVFNRRGELLIIKRKHEPFKEKFALPGGFVEWGESAEEAVLRELKEETGIVVRDLKLVGIYSAPGRDPRGHVVSVSYLVEVPAGAIVKAGSDAAEAEFRRDWRKLDFAFDHARIAADAAKLRWRFMR